MKRSKLLLCLVFLSLPVFAIADTDRPVFVYTVNYYSHDNLLWSDKAVVEMGSSVPVDLQDTSNYDSECEKVLSSQPFTGGTVLQLKPLNITKDIVKTHYSFNNIHIADWENVKSEDCSRKVPDAHLYSKKGDLLFALNQEKTLYSDNGHKITVSVRYSHFFSEKDAKTEPQQG